MVDVCEVVVYVFVILGLYVVVFVLNLCGVEGVFDVGVYKLMLLVLVMEVYLLVNICKMFV